MYKSLFKPLLILSISTLLLNCKNVPQTDNQQNQKKDPYLIYDQVNQLMMDDPSTSQWLKVRLGNKWGIVSKSNEVIHPIEYNEIINNRIGLVMKEEGLYKFFDSEGGRVGISEAQEIQSFGPDIFKAKKGGLYALLDHKGKELTPYAYNAISGNRNKEAVFARKEVMWEILGRNGKPISEPNPKQIQALEIYQSRVNLYGLGPIKTGMTLDQFEQLNINASEPAGSGSCQTIKTLAPFPAMSLLFEKKPKAWTLERIYIRDPGISTKSNIAIGSTGNDIDKAYTDRIQKRPNNYDSLGIDYHYVPKDNRDRLYRLNFAVSNGVLKRYSVGRLPAIEYVEGCF